MKCFHFTNGERRPNEEEVQDGSVSRASSKVSWVRSLSIASSNVDTRRSAFDSESRRDWTDSFGFHEFLTQRRANDLRVFTFPELKSATRGFTRTLMIGEGGFGCVYRGILKVSDSESGSESEMDVAVKQLNRSGFQGHKEWINEVNFLGVVKHPNLVKLVGYCAEDDERGIQRLLVYELMHNKSLEDHLLTRSASPLPWLLRLKIAQDAARGLAYLHEEMEFQLIFRDFKTSNILLDEDFNAKLSDFGLARQGPTAGFGHVSTSVVGTVGYAAPEYVHTGRLTAKSDVWSFGVVLYELITGRRVLERNLPRGEQKLLEWVRPYVSDPKKFHMILDPRLEEQTNMKSALKLASLANKCLMKHPKSRPKMSEVVEMLESIIDASSPQDECVPETVKEAENMKEETEESEPGKQENNQKKGFDFREMVLRNRSIGKLDWRNWTPGLVRT
ncbi:probable serine/threonine-protein kinase PBL19 isoform X2 [Olea europaea var. sylvestris]|uniref:probable serine/threonine-protein kinase PBL19 isoform X2 n=1 Tax=Olea europaea var. sylvestris TaxID=158386 RepID=UPI000C1D0233|nr:probable serine/threonine-protein kinase PBL19 isoform X2 [Olea europaea var. sylvestris]